MLLYDMGTQSTRIAAVAVTLRYPIAARHDPIEDLFIGQAGRGPAHTHFGALGVTRI